MFKKYRIMITEDYFEKLPDRLSEKIESLEDDLLQEAPLLHSMRDGNPYSVPHGYFKNLENQLTQKRSSLKVSYRKYLAVAASLLLLMAIGLQWSSDVVDDSGALAEVELYDYYLDNLDDVDEDLIALLSEDEESLATEMLFDDDEIEIVLDELVSDLNDYELDNLF